MQIRAQAVGIRKYHSFKVLELMQLVFDNCIQISFRVSCCANQSRATFLSKSEQSKLLSKSILYRTCGFQSLNVFQSFPRVQLSTNHSSRTYGLRPASDRMLTRLRGLPYDSSNGPIIYRRPWLAPSGSSSTFNNVRVTISIFRIG